MPKYRIETNQGNFEIEADREPTMAEVQAHLSGGQQPGQPTNHAAQSTAAEPWKPYFNSREEFEAAKQRQATEDVERVGSKAKMAGQALGSATMKVGLPAAAIAAAPFSGGASLAALGFASGAAGEYLGNQIAGEETTLGGALSAGIATTLPVGPVAGFRQVATEGAKQGLANLTSSVVQTAFDQQRLPTSDEAVSSFGMGALSPVIGKAMGSSASGALPDVSIDRGVQQGMYDNIAAMRKLGVKDAKGRLVKSVVVDPGAVKDRTPSIAKGLSGRASFAQDASIYNADAIQAAARESVKLSPEARPLSPDDIKGVIESGWEPYQTISAIQKQAKTQLADLEKQALRASGGHGSAIEADSPEFRRMADPLRLAAAADVDALKLARIKASAEMDGIHNRDPKASYEAFQGYVQQAEQLEDIIEQAAKASGDEKLLARLKEARKTIARGYNLKNATSLNGITDIRKLKKQMEAGAPLDGNLKTLALFADAVDKDVVPINRTGDPQLNGLNNEAAAVGTAVSPTTGWMARGLPLIGEWARKKVLAPDFQNKMFRQTRDHRMNTFLQGISRFSTMSTGRANPFLPQPTDVQLPQ